MICFKNRIAYLTNRSHSIGKIRFIFCADTHLGFDYPVRPRIERRRRGKEFFDNFDCILQRAAENDIDFLLHGGDLFFRSRLPAKVIDLVYKRILQCADSGRIIIIVPGNHERARLPESIFITHPNIYVFDKPKTFIFTFSGVPVSLSGFPFIRQDIRGRFKSILAETDWDKQTAELRLLCLHQAIEGAQVGPANYTFRSGADVIQRKNIPPAFDAVLAGHIHRKQVLRNRPDSKSAKQPIIYSGSTERTSFAEKEEDKGYYEIECHCQYKSDSKITRINFIKLSSRPMIDLIIDGYSSLDSIKKYLSLELSRISPDAIVRLKFKRELKPEIKKNINTAFLRDIFPDTMNFMLKPFISG